MQVASAAACGENSSGSRNSPSVLLQQQQQQQQQQATAGAANAELPPPLRVLEFFSGVGGWHMALAASSLRANVVGAFELNPNANTVYAHNFAPLSPRCVPAPPHHHPAACFCPRRRLTAPPPGACVASARRVAGGRGLNIEKLPTRELDSYRADMWVMSPPCQPFTRLGKRKDVADHRTDSCSSLLAKLPQLQRMPRYLLLENVQGFETSELR
jgi:tRNA (cytosine38-C5)-methyltransferase